MPKPPNRQIKTREEWLEERARDHGIGASDVYRLLGEGYEDDSPSQFLAERRGVAEPMAQTEAMWWGKADERTIALRYAENHPDYIVTDPGDYAIFRHKEHPWRFCTPDRFVQLVDDDRGLEIKLVEGWYGWLWEICPPLRARLQIAWTMHVIDLDSWDVAVRLGAHDYREFTVLRDLEFEDEVVSAVCDWRDRYLIGGDDPDPDGSPGNWALIRARYPDPEPKAKPLDPTSEQDRLAGELLTLAEMQARVANDYEATRQTMARTLNGHRAIKGHWGSFSRTTRGFKITQKRRND